MDSEKIGRLIQTLRTEQKLTQRQLGALLHISDKTVSKWERGLGYPDVSLLPKIAGVLGVNLESLLSGELETNDWGGDNMKRLKFYVCPSCGNLLTATSEAAIACCGKNLQVLVPQKAANDEKLIVEQIENDWFISSEHPMEKSHYISFIAVLTGDSIMLRRQYPEWNIQTRIPRFGRGTLIWYCTRDGLFCQPINR